MNDIHAQAHAYVVGALTPAEAAEFEEHLAGCPACQTEVAELRELATLLSATTATTPPPALRSAVLAAIAQTPQDSGETAAPTSPPATAPSAESGSTAHAASNVVPLRSRASRASGLLAAAAVLAAIGLGGWAVQNREAADDATAQTEQLTQLLAAGDVRTVSGRFTSGGGGTIVMSPSRGEAVLVGSELAELPDGRVYEAWTIDGEVPVPAGTFSPDDKVVPLPDTAFSAKSVAVTVEPKGGSDQPTSDAVFTVQMPQR